MGTYNRSKPQVSPEAVPAVTMWLLPQNPAWWQQESTEEQTDLDGVIGAGNHSSSCPSIPSVLWGAQIHLCENSVNVPACPLMVSGGKNGSATTQISIPIF